MSTAADIVVLGGGPAGTTAALALARAGARVILFERTLAPAFKPGEILEPTIRYPLAELGLFERFEQLGFLPIAGNLSLWGEESPVDADGMLNPHGSGYLVDRARMEEWLIAEARGANVTVVRGVRPAVERSNCWSVAWPESGRRQEALPGLIVQATGRSAASLGPGRRRRVDALVALLAYVPNPSGLAPDQRLYIEAVAAGWWYSATLPNGRSVLAFMTDADLLPSGTGARLAFFNARLAETRITRLRVQGTQPDSIRAWPAASTRRDAVAGPDWVAVGDAASTYDPLSGQGVAAAMSKGVGLARAIVGCASIGGAVADYARAEVEAYEDYLLMRQATYRRVQRWPGLPFWQRRH